MREVEVFARYEGCQLLSHCIVELRTNTAAIRCNQCRQCGKCCLLKRAVVLTKECGAFKHTIAANTGNVCLEFALGNIAEYFERGNTRRLVFQPVQQNR